MLFLQLLFGHVICLFQTCPNLNPKRPIENPQIPTTGSGHTVAIGISQTENTAHGRGATSFPVCECQIF